MLYPSGSIRPHQQSPALSIRDSQPICLNNMNKCSLFAIAFPLLSLTLFDVKSGSISLNLKVVNIPKNTYKYIFLCDFSPACLIYEEKAILLHVEKARFGFWSTDASEISYILHCCCAKTTN